MYTKSLWSNLYCLCNWKYKDSIQDFSRVFVYLVNFTINLTCTYQTFTAYTVCIVYKYTVYTYFKQVVYNNNKKNNVIYHFILTGGDTLCVTDVSQTTTLERYSQHHGGNLMAKLYPSNGLSDISAWTKGVDRPTWPYIEQWCWRC